MTITYLLTVGCLGIATVLFILWVSRRTRRSGAPPPTGDHPATETLPPRSPTIAPSLPPPLVPTAPRTRAYPYVQRTFITDAERRFFSVLQTAIPYGWAIFPQVRLGSLLDVAPQHRAWKGHFQRIAAKCVDFVICDVPNLTPRLVIELDDSSHTRADRQARDAFVDGALQSAGLPILHVAWKPHYDATLLRDAISDLLAHPEQSPRTLDATPKRVPTVR